MCVASIRRYSASHPVIFLDQNNLKEYIDVPEIVYEKIQKGIFQFQIFSDLVRHTLLTKYGGFWIDATAFITSQPKEFVRYDKPFFTIKITDRTKQSDPWMPWILGGIKGNPFNAFSADVLREYMIKENYLLDYFVVCYAGNLGRTLLPQVRKLVDDVEINNPNWWYTVDNATKPYDEQRWLEVQKDTSIFKLSYKHKWDGYSDDPNCLCQYLLRNSK